MTTTPLPTSPVPVIDVAPPRSWRRMLAAIGTPTALARPVEVGAFRRVATLWATGRALNLLILAAWFEISSTNRWSFGPDGYRAGTFLNFLTGWDADRYGTIATEGYPVSLPTDSLGTVLPNNWAFLPVFPGLTSFFSTASGLSWRFVAVAIALAAGLAATWFLYLLLRQVTSPEAAWWATSIFTVAPLSFVLVLGYSEGLFLALMFAALYLAVRRQYLWITPLGVIAAFTRPGALALALGLGLVWAARWIRRDRDPFPIVDRAQLAVAAIATGLAGSAWPVIADAVTGVPHTYVRTETGWWLDSVGDFPFVPFTPWFRLGGAGLGALGILLVIGIMVLFAVFLRSKGMRALGGVVWAYILSYGLYLFAVFLPTQSLLRILMPLSPALAHQGIVGTRRRRMVVIIGCLALQPLAALVLWTIGNP